MAITRRVASVAFASWCATLAAAASCAEQLALSHSARLSLVLPAMLGVHSLIGVGEAVITALVVASVLRFRPELHETEGAGLPSRGGAALGASALGLSVTVVALLAPLASAAPDGLSRVAALLGFQGRAQAALSAPLAEYRVPGLRCGVLPALVAGSFGTLLMFGLCWLLALALVPRSRRSAPSSTSQVADESSG